MYRRIRRKVDIHTLTIDLRGVINRLENFERKLRDAGKHGEATELSYSIRRLRDIISRLEYP